MTTKEFIHKVFKGELGQLDALNISFEITNKEKLRIEILITEIDQFCKSKTFIFRQVIEWRIDVANLEWRIDVANLRRIDLANFLPTDFNYYQGFLDDGFNDFELREIDDKVKNYVDEHLIKEFFDYCNLDLVKDLYPDLCKSLNQLKTDLSDFLDSQSEVPTSEKKQSKGVWGLAARYKFLVYLEFSEKLKLLGMQKNDLNRIVSQILGCDVSTARNLINNSYPSDEKKDEQLDREQLEALIKQHQVNKKG